MNARLRVRLQTTPEQDHKLRALQHVFVKACNVLAAQARSTGVWSRVGLHQMAYHRLRTQFPELGSQMLCNVIYSVSRACRLIYQNPRSPFGLRARGRSNLPLLRFGDDAPVYFDRHTLSVREGHASMYSMDGRLRFNLPLAPEHEYRLRHGGIREIALTRDAGSMIMTFSFAQDGDPGPAARRPAPEGDDFPSYLLLLDEPAAAPVGAARLARVASATNEERRA
jgi:hypothetical protein